MKDQAEADKLDAIQQRTSQRTTDLMLRFGSRSALAGTSMPGLIGVGMDKLFNR